MRQKCYDSDLTDSQWEQQWEQISRYFTTGRKRSYSLRYHVLDAILYIVKTGTQWRMLPGEFAQWQTVYYYFRRWREEGRILCILSITSRAVRRRSGRHGEPSALIVDYQSVPSTRVGGIRSFDAFKKVNGRKRHIAVDTQGLLWGLVVHAAGDHETQWALQLLAPLASRLGRVETVFADQAYQGLEEILEEELSWELQVVESDDLLNPTMRTPGSPSIRSDGSSREPSVGSEDGAGWTESTNGELTPARRWCTSPCSALP